MDYRQRLVGRSDVVVHLCMYDRGDECGVDEVIDRDKGLKGHQTISYRYCKFLD